MSIVIEAENNFFILGRYKTKTPEKSVTSELYLFSKQEEGKIFQMTIFGPYPDRKGWSDIIPKVKKEIEYYREIIERNGEGTLESVRSWWDVDRPVYEKLIGFLNSL